jgi:hypothetical protein
MDNILLNLLYAEWLKTNDPYEEDFEGFVFQKTGREIMKLSELEYQFK